MMKPLFTEEEEKSNESTLNQNKRRIVEVIEPLLKSIHLEYDFADSELSEGVHIKIYTRKNPDKTLSVIPWVRPVSLTIRHLVKNLGNYPRLNLTKLAKKVPVEDKIPYMIRNAKENNLYFLVILPRTIGEPLLWLDRYDSVPLKKWKLTYRKDPAILDRIVLSKYKETGFSTKEQIKEQILKILK